MDPQYCGQNAAGLVTERGGTTNDRHSTNPTCNAVLQHTTHILGSLPSPTPVDTRSAPTLSIPSLFPAIAPAFTVQAKGDLEMHLLICAASVRKCCRKECTRVAVSMPYDRHMHRILTTNRTTGTNIRRDCSLFAQERLLICKRGIKRYQAFGLQATSLLPAVSCQVEQVVSQPACFVHLLRLRPPLTHASSVKLGPETLHERNTG